MRERSEIEDLERAFLSGVVMAASISSRERDLLPVLAGLKRAMDNSRTPFFFVPRNQAIASAMLDLWVDEARGGVAAVADTQRIYREIPRGTVADWEALEEYLLYAGAISNLDEGLRTLQEFNDLRRLTALGQNLEREAAAGAKPARELISDITQDLLRIENQQGAQDRLQGVTFAEVGEQVMENILENVEHRDDKTRYAGARCGISNIDHCLGGSLRPGSVLVLAARPGKGKTSLAAKFLRTTASQDPSRWAAFVSLEMTEEDILEREIATSTGIDTRRLQAGHLQDDDLEVIREALEGIKARQIVLYDSSFSAIGDVIAALQAKTLQKGTPPSLVVIDYLQLFDTSGSDSSGNLATALGEISRAIKTKIANGLRTPVVLLSQLNREIEHRQGGRPQMSDLRDSGAIEADADVIMFLYDASNRPPAEDSPEPEYVEVWAEIVKHRKGPKGRWMLAFYMSRTDFRQIERYTDGSGGPVQPPARLQRRALIPPDEEGRG
ncbi:MAG: AAA family ATPase [Desulfobacterota bacterium]|jgi:replicative DNA helicase|nr:AAA family ATPase [Thermodesulfobacteriota bacterium]